MPGDCAFVRKHSSNATTCCYGIFGMRASRCEDRVQPTSARGESARFSEPIQDHRCALAVSLVCSRENQEDGSKDQDP